MSRKIALVTGATRGLGAHLVRRFWLEGYDLAVVVRNTIAFNEVAKLLPSRPEQSIKRIEIDLSDAGSVAALLEDFEKKVGTVSVLVNNAGIQGPIGPFCSNDLESWSRTVQVNLLAPVALCRAVIPTMLRVGEGAVINLSGGGAASPRENFSAYSASKTALVRFTETIAKELSGTGVRVNCVAPGAMKTSMMLEVMRNAEASGVKELEAAKTVFDSGGASMDAVADLMIFLASERGRDISGKLISAVWDNWEQWPSHLDQLTEGDVYTLRRITGRDRGFGWLDK